MHYHFQKFYLLIDKLNYLLYLNGFENNYSNSVINIKSNILKELTLQKIYLSK